MDKIVEVKSYICVLGGLVGGYISSLVGGFNQSFKILVLLMVIDYITGFMLGFIFKKSPKTENGSLSSSVGFKGIAKKILIFIYIIIAFQMDKLLNTNFVKDVVIIGFIINETISISENASIMGVPLPKILKKALDILEEKNDENTNKIK